jgi:hypothetical protein
MVDIFELCVVRLICHLHLGFPPIPSGPLRAKGSPKARLVPLLSVQLHDLLIVQGYANEHHLSEEAARQRLAEEGCSIQALRDA